jgi:hypothetical protein
MCRSHVPTDINIHSISSHAQAEALVQPAQQSILDMEAEADIVLSSVKLAAYSENLALERQLKRAGEERNGDSQMLEDDAMTTHTTFSRDGGMSSRSPHVHEMCALSCLGPPIIISNNVEFLRLFSIIRQTFFAIYK